MNKTMTLEQLQSIAYERYKLTWMASHGKTAGELFRHVIGTYVENLDPDDGNFEAQDIMQVDPDEMFRNWEQETGFDGELWVCKDEFLDAEFNDTAYMAGILTKTEYETYLRLTGITEENTRDIKYVLVEVIEREASQPEIFDSLEAAKSKMLDHIKQTLGLDDTVDTAAIQECIENFEGELKETSAYCTRHNDNYDWTIFEIKA